jgi:hypothetical protein
MGEARGELERRYPESQGYKITSLIDVSRESTGPEVELVL